MVGIVVGTAVAVIVGIVVVASSGSTQKPSPVASKGEARGEKPAEKSSAPRAPETADACFARLREFAARGGWSEIGALVDPDRKRQNVAMVYMAAVVKVALTKREELQREFFEKARSLGCDMTPAGPRLPEVGGDALDALVAGVSDLASLLAVSYDMIVRSGKRTEQFRYDRIKAAPVEVVGDAGRVAASESQDGPLREYVYFRKRSGGWYLTMEQPDAFAPRAAEPRSEAGRALRALEERITAARTLCVRSHLELGEAGQRVKVDTEILVSGGRFRVSVLSSGTSGLLAVYDGSTLYRSSPKVREPRVPAPAGIAAAVKAMAFRMDAMAMCGALCEEPLRLMSMTDLFENQSPTSRPDDIVGGATCKVYRFTSAMIEMKEGLEVTLWVDARRGLPVRREIRRGGVERVETFREFELDGSVDAASFVAPAKK